MPKLVDIHNNWLYRFDWLEEDSPSCFVCGYYNSLEKCHLIPRALGGTNDLDNLVVLCQEHHRNAPNTSISKSVMLNWIDRENEKYCCLKGYNIKNSIIKETLDTSIKLQETIHEVFGEGFLYNFEKYKGDILKSKVIIPSSHNRANFYTTLVNINEELTNNPELLANIVLEQHFKVKKLKN